MAIDDKVVAMSFEGSKFEAGVRTTLAALEKLKSALKFEGSTKGLNDISNASKRMDFSRMASGIEDIKGRLGALRLTAIAAFSQIAASAIRSGLQLAKSFTIGPLQAGFQEYSTNLNSVQTILANTAAQGTKLKDVNNALDELNRYSDKTIYNFGQMAKNIGTFTAAGVDLKTSTAAIKGIANLAALSGSSAEQASSAMYQLSQAIASGRVSLMDWNSVVNAGMGGAVFQKALAQTAESMGALKEGAVKMVGPMKQLKINGESFRDSVGGPGPKWLTSDILVKTLQQFTGDMSVAQLKAEGFNDAQIKAIQATAKNAMLAATNVKTLSQVLSVAKETAGSGWAKTWQIVFGNFGEAKSTFTALSNTINGFINKSAEARNKVLEDWKALGGRTVLINSIKIAFHNLGLILAPIKEAFRDIFPAKTGKDLYNLTLQFKEFAQSLKPSAETVENLRHTFRGVFALFDIGIQVVKGIFTALSRLFGAVGGGNGGFLKFTASIGDFLVALDQAIKKGDGFTQFFVKIGDILALPVKFLLQIGHAIANLFSGFSPGGFSGQLASLGKVTGSFKQNLDAVVEALKELGPAISKGLSDINWDTVLSIVKTGLFGALVLMIRNFIGGSNLKQIFGIMGKNIGRSFGAGILGNISKAFGGLTGTLSAMQTELKARTLEEIAIAIALLTASVVALTLIDPDKLGGAMGALIVMMGGLVATMAALDKVTAGASFIKLPIIAAGLILLAGAIDLLTLSVLAMSRLSWSELVKGLSGVGALLVGLSAASIVLSRNSAGMIRSGFGIMAIAVAMKILASAVADFGAMNWTQIVKGLAGVGGGLVAIAGAMQLMPKNMVFRSVALIAVAAALQIIANAMEKFGGMNWTQIGKGLAGIGGSLVVIAGALHLMPKNMALTGAGLLLVALSLGRIASAVEKMGGMSIKQIAKGLVGLGGALLVLAGGLYAMSGTLAGASALSLAASGLALLIPALILLGRQSWGTLLKGLIGLGAALGVIAGAALLLSPSIPALLGFGAALVVIGAGLALAGAGIALIGVGLSAIAVSGTASVGILVTALVSLVESLVRIAKDLVMGILAIVKAFADAAPKFAEALVKIVASLLQVVIESAPKIAEAFEALLRAGLEVLKNNAPRVIQAGLDLIMALLTGIRNNISRIVTGVVEVITRFLSAISSNLGKIITAGGQILISLLKGIANNLAQVTTAVLSIVTKFLDAIANNLGKMVTAGMNIVVKLLSGIASKIGEVIKAGTDIIVNLVTGIGNAGARIVTAGVNAMIKFVNAVSKGAVKLIDAGMKAVINFLNGVAAAINANAGEMRAAGMNIAFAIADGMSFGLLSRAKSLASKAASIGHSIIGAMKSAVGARSPSKEAFDIGNYVIMGLANGMTKNAALAYSSATNLGNGVIDTFNTIFQTHSPSKVMMEIGKYVGRGFAEGLRGSKEDINKAFTELNDKLTETMATARETIKKEQDKLDELRKAKKPDAEAIRETQKILDENEAILARSTAGHKALVKTLKDEKAELIGLTSDYDKISTKIKAAQQVLADAMKTRDDAVKSYTNQYSTLPALVKEDAEGASQDQLAAYLDALRNQVSAVGTYKATLEQLRKLGLDDATYRKLLEEGTADQEFANQLLAGGKTAIEGLNELDRQLVKNSTVLALDAAQGLYQAGVDSAQGLLNGLESKRNALKKKMNHIAQDILNELRRELKIKSPSQAFAEIGAYAMEGFAEGIFGNVALIRNAVSDTVNETMDALKATMKKAINTSDISMRPVITPVLDLSLVKAKSGELAALTDVNSYSQASAISTQQTTDETAAASAATQITFEQNNYSPEALSDIEIYRQTRNQLSQLKSAFAT